MCNDKYFGISKRIIPWKTDSDFEVSLSLLAQESEEGKRLYSLYYQNIDPVYFEKGKEIAYSLISMDESELKNKDFDSVYSDMVYCLHRYGLSFQDYIIYNLWNKTELQRSSFVSDKLRYYYIDILNAPGISDLLTNKLKCYNLFKQFYKRECIGLIDKNDKKGYVDFINFIKHNKIFIYKPLSSHSGKGIIIIDSNNINPLEWYNNVCDKAPGIIEELIIQGSELNTLNSNSINSCRIMTFTIGNNVHIIGGALRMGVGDSITDNAGAGGIYANINIDYGIIQSDAKNYNNKHYTLHPTTNIQIIGFKLPEWNNAIELIKNMAVHKQGATLVSWDIAYSDKGWVMIEGNANGDWSIIQSNLEKGIKKELYQLMDKYFEYKK